MSTSNASVDPDSVTILSPHLVDGEKVLWAQSSVPAPKISALLSLASQALWAVVSLSFAAFGAWGLISWAGMPFPPAFSDLANLFWFAAGTSVFVLIIKAGFESGSESSTTWGITDQRIISINKSAGDKASIIGPLPGVITLQTTANGLGTLSVYNPHDDDETYLSMQRVHHARAAEQLITEMFLRETISASAQSK